MSTGSDLLCLTRAEIDDGSGAGDVGNLNVDLVVDAFPLSTKRQGHWDNFVKIVERLKQLKVPCKLWVDGSIFTKRLSHCVTDRLWEMTDMVEMIEAFEARQLVAKRQSLLAS